jgi:thiol-disulfide isomerase/thioredoxin
MRAPHLLAATALSALWLAGCGPDDAVTNNQAVPGNEQATAVPAAAPESEGVLDRSHAGSVAPGTAFKDPQGDRTTLADFRGKPLLLNLWATWCAPCIAEMPTLDALAAREGGKLTVLTVSQDLIDNGKVAAFFDQHKLATIEPYVDDEAQLSTDLKVQTLPTTILYDANGKEIWRTIGGEDWRSGKTAALIKEAVKE